MTLKEARETLEKERRDHHSFSTDIIGKAMALGEEALKHIQHLKGCPSGRAWLPLPGETED